MQSAVIILLGLVAIVSISEARDLFKRDNGHGRDHNKWTPGKKDEIRKDDDDNQYYQFENNKWVKYNGQAPRPGTGPSNNGPSSWGRGTKGQERTEGNKHYVFDGNNWTEDNGDHFNWKAGRQGEEKQDTKSGRYYKYNGNQWVWDTNRSG